VNARVDAYDVIRHDALGGIERLRLQPERQLAEVHAEVERAIDDYQRRARLGDEVPLGDVDAMLHRVLRSITDLGPLTDLLARDDVEEIFVEGSRVTYLDTKGRLCGLGEPTTEEENRLILDRLLAETDRQLNAKHPLVQARVLDGTARLTAAISPIADRLSATVRRYVGRARRSRRAVGAGRVVLVGARATAQSDRDLGRARCGEDDAGRGIALRGTGRTLCPLLRGDPGAVGADRARRLLRSSTARARWHR
jgi:pilus assembly protein CpaF